MAVELAELATSSKEGIESRSPLKTKEEVRVPVLDGIRGLAILLVTTFRFGEIAFTDEMLGGLPRRVFYLGATGVDLFFVLSGFLITGILLNTRHRDDYFRRFYFRRTLRIFPLYYVTLLALLVVLPFVFGNRMFLDGLNYPSISLWTYTSNLALAWNNDWGLKPLEHFWSLAVEEQFYLLWPLFVFWVSSRWIGRISILFLLTVASSRILFSFLEFGDVTEKTFTFFRLDGLLMGSMAAMFAFQNANLSALHAKFRIGLVAAGGLYAFSLLLGSHDYAIRYSLISLVWVFLLMAAVSSDRGHIEHRILRSLPLRILGKYSYAMYIFQSPLIPLVSFFLTPAILSAALGNSYVGAACYIVSMFAITFVLSVVSWYCLERPILRLRDAR